MKALFVRGGNDAHGPDRVGNRTTQMFGQLQNLISSAGPLGTIAAVNVDQVGSDQHLGRLLDQSRVSGGGFHHPVLFGRPDGNTRFFTFASDDIFGNQNVRRSRPSTQRDPEGVPDHIRNTVPVVHLAVPFDRRLEYVQVMTHLHTALLKIGIGNFTAPGCRDGNDRTPLCLGAHDTGYQVGCARPGTGHNHRRLTGYPGVGIAGMRSGCLVARYDQAEAQLVP